MYLTLFCSNTFAKRKKQYVQRPKEILLKKIGKARGDGRILHKYIYNKLPTQLTLRADVLQNFYVKSKTERPTVGTVCCTFLAVPYSVQHIKMKL
jgi:hypothetical protein